MVYFDYYCFFNLAFWCFFSFFLVYFTIVKKFCFKIASIISKRKLLIDNNTDNIKNITATSKKVENEILNIKDTSIKKLTKLEEMYNNKKNILLFNRKIENQRILKNKILLYKQELYILEKEIMIRFDQEKEKVTSSLKDYIL